MELLRIILTTPFMRHPAGLVFELPYSNEPIGWDPDTRVRERQSFSGKQAFRLPDAGRGQEVNLPQSDTVPCPPKVFEGVDIRTGPCRITALSSGTGPERTSDGLQTGWALREPDLSLFDIAGRRSQGIRIRIPDGAPLPHRVEVINVLHEQTTQTFPVSGRDISLDFSGLEPGFYRMLIACEEDLYHSIRFMKSFPLLVVMEGGGRYRTQETMY